MNKILLFLFFYLNIAAISFGQITPTFVRFDSPSFVSVNGNFTTSLIFKVNSNLDKSVVIRFAKPKLLKINSALFKSASGDVQIPIVRSVKNKNEIQLILNFDECNIEPYAIHQIFLNFNSRDQFKIEKKYFTWLDDSLLKKRNDDSNLLEEENADEISVYTPQKTAGSSLQFKQSSQLKFEIKEEEKLDNLYTEFWFKSSGTLKNFLTFTKSETNDTILSISKNKIGFITFPISENELSRKDIYLGDNVWNYIGLNLKRINSKTYCNVYVNSSLAYSNIIDNDFDIEKFSLTFLNKREKSPFEIDRLKIWKFGNSILLANNNKHFLAYEADSSNIIYQSNFDNVGEFNSSNKSKNLQAFTNQIIYKKSDAPIFSKAPSLTVKVGSSYNSFVWYVQEYSFAKEFEIEKSLSDNKYKVVYRTGADEDPLKIYYFTDELITNNEVAFYRVKQINQDGSSVYSAEVKVGNKEINEFKLGQNYPNPFNPITSIYVEVIIPGEFKVKVYDIVGNTVSDLHNGFLAEGMHTFEFDGANIPSGIYFYEVISPKSQSVKKMILAK